MELHREFVSGTALAAVFLEGNTLALEGPVASAKTAQWHDPHGRIAGPQQVTRPNRRRIDGRISTRIGHRPNRGAWRSQASALVGHLARRAYRPRGPPRTPCSGFVPHHVAALGGPRGLPGVDLAGFLEGRLGQINSRPSARVVPHSPRPTPGTVPKATNSLRYRCGTKQHSPTTRLVAPCNSIFR
jgi:hypothetical protein